MVGSLELGFEGEISGMGSTKWDIWGVVGLRIGFLKISRMGVGECSNSCE